MARRDLVSELMNEVISLPGLAGGLVGCTRADVYQAFKAAGHDRFTVDLYAFSARRRDDLTPHPRAREMITAMQDGSFRGVDAYC